jgi:hypothetical protein
MLSRFLLKDKEALSTLTGALCLLPFLGLHLREGWVFPTLPDVEHSVLTLAGRQGIQGRGVWHLPLLLLLLFLVILGFEFRAALQSRHSIA